MPWNQSNNEKDPWGRDNNQSPPDLDAVINKLVSSFGKLFGAKDTSNGANGGGGKKGSSFMPAHERVKMIRAFECVDACVEAVDEDRTVRKTLELLSLARNFFGRQLDNRLLLIN